MIMRLNALPVTVCCCPITSSFFDRWVFALHLDPDSKRHEAHRPKDQFLVGQSAYYYVGLVPIWRLEGSLMHPAAERDCLKNPSGPELSSCEPTKQGKEALFWGCTPIKKYAPDAFTLFFKQSQKVYSRKPVFIHPYTLRYRGVGKGLVHRLPRRVLLENPRTYAGTSAKLRPLLARVELPGGKVFSHLLARSLDEPGVLEDALDLLSGGIAADVLFLQHFPEVRPVLDAVDNVLKYLILAPRSVVGAEDLSQKERFCSDTFAHNLLTLSALSTILTRRS